MSCNPLEFFGTVYTLPASIMGVTPQEIGELAGIQMDALIGCDLLSQHDIRIRWKDHALDIGDQLPDGQITSNLRIFMGIPIFSVCLRGNNMSAIFDTGAHLSYIDPQLVSGEVPLGECDDFYPFVGRFTTPTYLVSTALDENPIDVEYGILPDALQVMLGMVLLLSGSSAVIGPQLLNHFDCTVSWARETISWTRK